MQSDIRAFSLTCLDSVMYSFIMPCSNLIQTVGHSCIRSSMHACIRSLCHHASNHSFMHSSSHRWSQPSMYSCIRSLFRTFTHSFIYSVIHSFVMSFIHAIMSPLPSVVRFWIAVQLLLVAVGHRCVLPSQACVWSLFACHNTSRRCVAWLVQPCRCRQWLHAHARASARLAEWRAFWPVRNGRRAIRGFVVVVKWLTRAE